MDNNISIINQIINYSSNTMYKPNSLHHTNAMFGISSIQFLAQA